MKIVSVFSAIFLFIFTGWSGNKQLGNSDGAPITVDVTKTYSSKKERILQDFMNVEYIALETKNGFYNQGVVLDIR
jgi:hypothetical protein